jgi:hypothetical protein
LNSFETRHFQKRKHVPFAEQSRSGKRIMLGAIPLPYSDLTMLSLKMRKQSAAKYTEAYRKTATDRGALLSPLGDQQPSTQQTAFFIMPAGKTSRASWLRWNRLSPGFGALTGVPASGAQTIPLEDKRL